MKGTTWSIWNHLALGLYEFSGTATPQGFHGFNTEFPLHKLRSRKPTNRYKLVRKHQPRDHQQFQFVNFVRTWKFAAPADSSVSLAHPQVLPGACRGTPSATPDLTRRHLDMDPGSLSGPVQLESLRFKKDDITKNYVKQYRYGWKSAKCHAAFPQCKRVSKSHA